MKSKLLTSMIVATMLITSVPIPAFADGPDKQVEDRAVKPSKGEVILNKYNGTVEIVIYNKKQKCTLVIIKKDCNSKKPIEGAEFVIRDEGGNEVYRGKTDKDGRIVVELPCGKYYYEEIKPADGYTLD